MLDGVLSKANDNAYDLFQARSFISICYFLVYDALRFLCRSENLRPATCMSSPPRGLDLLNRVRE